MERHTRARVHARDAGLRRLKVATGGLTIATAALAGIFAGLAAQSSSGARKVAVRVVRTTAPRVHVQQRIPPPPQLPALASVPAGGGDDENPPPAPSPQPQPQPQSQPQPPPQAPTPTPVQPVVVSGGS
jgi:hypothetical protein